MIFKKSFFFYSNNRFTGVRQEQDIYIRLIDSVTKQVSWLPLFFLLFLSFCLFGFMVDSWAVIPWLHLWHLRTILPELSGLSSLTFTLIFRMSKFNSKCEPESDLSWTSEWADCVFWVRVLHLSWFSYHKSPTPYLPLLVYSFPYGTGTSNRQQLPFQKHLFALLSFLACQEPSSLSPSFFCVLLTTMMCPRLTVIVCLTNFSFQLQMEHWHLNSICQFNLVCKLMELVNVCPFFLFQIVTKTNSYWPF